ncbi:MAG: hypothetical protein KDA44_02385 [Planctomycetales bacterium]|nr:hypothetical protein [Planctomycetales bacterium]
MWNDHNAVAGTPRPVTDPRAIDGTGNNLANDGWGAGGAQLVRVSQTPSSTGAYYPDGGDGGIFAGGPGSSTSLANPRDVSNVVMSAGGGSPTNTHLMSGMVYQWGQFLDHDITHVGTSGNVAEMSMIAVSGSDPLFPGIPFSRSEYDPATGTSAANPRQQLNGITAYIDASNVYGSDATRQAALRDVGGKLKTSAGNLMPFNTAGLPNASNPGQDQSQLFLAGDVRANEQLGLTAMHTLFMREHNRLVDSLAANNPLWTGDELYNTARKIVGAEIQTITYNEFLPAVLGANAPRVADYSYDSTLNAGISNEFATALFRFGHSLLPEELPLAAVGSAPAGGVPLRDAFFTTGYFAGDATGSTDRVAQLLKGISLQKAMEVDVMIIDDVRNFLFGPPGAGGMDLASLNIQRGRDHGLPFYNDMREAYGLDAAATFADITSDVDLQTALASVYGNVSEVDAWVGALAEDHAAGAAFGDLIAAGMIDQFTRLRDGDRYFYAADAELMDNPAVSAVIDFNAVNLSSIIAWNTGMSDMPGNVFHIIPEPGAWALAALGAITLLRRRNSV